MLRQSGIGDSQPGLRKEFEAIFRGLIREKSERKVWEDFIVYSACNISIATGQDRGEKLDNAARDYTDQELHMFSDMLHNVAAALDKNPQQDYLGDMYMQMGLGSKVKSQYFTPYNMALMTVRLGMQDNARVIKDRIRGDYWTSVYEFACGGGVFVIAVANELRRAGVNYQKDILFVCQDRDEIAAMMCYIQISLIGCPGYIKIGDTLTDPIQSRDEKGLLPVGDVWITPMMGRDVWAARVNIAYIEWKIQNNIAVTADEWAAMMWQLKNN